MASKELTADDIVKLMAKVWATTDDIKVLGCVGINRALIIKREIKRRMKEDGMIVPRYLVSMKYVLEYFKINEELIKKYSMIGENNGK